MILRGSEVGGEAAREGGMLFGTTGMRLCCVVSRCCGRSGLHFIRLQSSIELCARLSEFLGVRSGTTLCKYATVHRRNYNPARPGA